MPQKQGYNLERSLQCGLGDKCKLLDDERKKQRDQRNKVVLSTWVEYNVESG